MKNRSIGHNSAYKNEILCGSSTSVFIPISLIIKRWLAIVALVLILASFGGAWVGKGQTLPPGTLPMEQAEYRVYLPVVEAGNE